MTELGETYRRSDNFVFRRIEGETILVPIRAGAGELDSIYILNEVSDLIWQSLDGSTTLTAIKNLIATEYDVADSQAEADLLEFMRDMQAIDAVKPVER